MYGSNSIYEVFIWYFSNNTLLILFSSAVLYFFLRAKKEIKVAMVVALLLLLCFFNDWVYRLFIRLGEETRYYRNMWIVPYVTIVAIMFVDVSKLLRSKTSNHIIKTSIVLLITLFLGIVMLMSEPVNPFNYYLNIPLNVDLVSRDVKQIGEYFESIKNKDNRKISVVCGYSTYEQMWLCYGDIDVVHSATLSNGYYNGEDLLSSDNPDVEYITKKLNERKLDYFIALKTENSQSVYQSFGYEPVFISDSFLLYKVIQDEAVDKNAQETIHRPTI